MSKLRTSQMMGQLSQQYEEIINESLFRMHCCLPCIVQSYNASNNTIECQPSIREEVYNNDNTTRMVNLPLLINVPVLLPASSYGSIKMPLKQNDEVLVLFSDLSIDEFWLKGTVQNQIESRRHDLSDGLAIPSYISLPKLRQREVNKIEFTSTDILLTTSTVTYSVNLIKSDIVNLETRMSDAEDEIEALKDRVTNLEEKVSTFISKYNTHIHIVEIGEDSYPTGAPNNQMTR